MKPMPNKSIISRGLRQTVTTLAVAAALAGWAVLARPDAPTTMALAAPVPATQVVVAQVPASQAPAPRLRVVTAAPPPVTTTRSSR